MNELINDKGVCRTAPATPGLLKRAWNSLGGGKIKLDVSGLKFNLNFCQV